MDGANVYWADSTAVWKMPLSGGTPVPLVSATTLRPWNIAVDSTSVYWTDYEFQNPGTVDKLTPK